MIILLNLIVHYLYLTLLFSAWLLPIFAVEVYDNHGNKKRKWYVSLAIMMLLKIFWPNTKVEWLLEKRS